MTAPRRLDLPPPAVVAPHKVVAIFRNGTRRRWT
jgi:hypothetical protein